MVPAAQALGKGKEDRDERRRREGGLHRAWPGGVLRSSGMRGWGCQGRAVEGCVAASCWVLDSSRSSVGRREGASLTLIWRPCVYSSRYARPRKVQARSASTALHSGSGLAREAQSSTPDSSDCFLGQALAQTEPCLPASQAGPGEGWTPTWAGVPVSFLPL